MKLLTKLLSAFGLVIVLCVFIGMTIALLWSLKNEAKQRYALEVQSIVPAHEPVKGKGK